MPRTASSTMRAGRRLRRSLARTSWRPPSYTAVRAIELLFFLAAGELHGGGVHDDDVVARVEKRHVGRAMLALQQLRRLGGDPAEHLAIGVDHVPPALDRGGTRHKRTHEPSLRPSRGTANREDTGRRGRLSRIRRQFGGHPGADRREARRRSHLEPAGPPGAADTPARALEPAGRWHLATGHFPRAANSVPLPAHVSGRRPDGALDLDPIDPLTDCGRITKSVAGIAILRRVAVEIPGRPAGIREDSGHRVPSRDMALGL